MPDVLERLRDVRVVAVIRAPDADGAIRAVDALVRGGVTGIEITYSTPGVPRRARGACARRTATTCCSARAPSARRSTRARRPTRAPSSSSAPGSTTR